MGKRGERGATISGWTGIVPVLVGSGAYSMQRHQQDPVDGAQTALRV
jgi:hypothetical protein